MTTEKDSRLVDYLYGELSDDEAEAFEQTLESDAALSLEVTGFEETLATLRTVEAEEPSSHLDSLILASARRSAEEEAKKSWFRKIFASPLAGLVAAGSVAMIAALVSVPAMMSKTSEEAAPSLEQAQVERIPTPDPAPVTTVDSAPEEEQRDPETPQGAVENESKKKKAKKAQPARSRVSRDEPPKPKAVTAAKPAPVAPAKRELEKLNDQARTTFADKADADTSAGDGVELDRLATGRAAGPKAGADAPVETPPAPPATASVEQPVQPVRPPADPADDDDDETVERSSRKESTRTKTPALDFQAEQGLAAKDRRADDEAKQREEQGRSMLLAASAEFKRGNPVGGRAILVRALAIAQQAPVHAEIAFRLAQHDFDRGAYAEAMRYARIASAAPKFDKRNAALEILVEAEKRLAEQRSKAVDLEEAPAPAAEDAR